jgi:hypothetical protein
MPVVVLEQEAESGKEMKRKDNAETRSALRFAERRKSSPQR